MQRRKYSQELKQKAVALTNHSGVTIKLDSAHCRPLLKEPIYVSISK